MGASVISATNTCKLGEHRAGSGVGHSQTVAKVDISLQSHNRIHVVRASANMLRTRGDIATRVCVSGERKREMSCMSVYVCVHVRRDLV